ncbi:uncharacterized protein N7496_007655 [Penicillium cataractarum]|uniref:Uncharacterized protein n=1 Tax=Penicillium cataractarum TaxID=2100454 RepID=A0A9W9RX32_9EURO|nr:uncharacterized protein N7496_007655 [Penicillium cataractarum]KAJ5367895.1 hypothetical protein N7496_007655 [Penicillium cataractarum]
MSATEVTSKTVTTFSLESIHGAGQDGWNFGYNRNDPSTRKAANLPFTHRGGIFARYGIAHEHFVWDLKSEPQLIGKFAKIWGTDELYVSFVTDRLSQGPNTNQIADKEKLKLFLEEKRG